MYKVLLKLNVLMVWLWGIQVGLAQNQQAPAQANAAYGILKFDVLEHDFGKLQEGTDPMFVFKYQNVGTVPIKLMEVRPSCGCTTPDWSREALAPQKTGEIKVKYSTLGRLGAFRKAITIKTDASPQEIVLYITGEVEPIAFGSSAVTQGSVSLDKELVDLGIVPVGTTQEVVFYMQNKGERPIQITEVKPMNPQLTASWDRFPFFKMEVTVIKLKLKIEETGLGKMMDTSVVVETNDAVQPKKSLRIKWIAGAKTNP